MAPPAHRDPWVIVPGGGIHLLLFLANNLQYIVNTIRHYRLRGLLGEEWVARHAAKARQHAANYERVSWGKVAAEVPAVEVGAGVARVQMWAFVEAACAAQAGWVVVDAGMREEVREAVRGMVVPAYRGFFYQRWRAAVEEGEAAKLSPEIVPQRLAGLFSSSDEAGSGSFSSYQLGSESLSSRSEASSRSL
ncbi:exocyst complex component EXO70B2-like [Curcuma longa]|uniref:exocyst complex component EXO70B2-like n=1 Tax=Curcuma longa TaxID=136217 RepID=UPI003D9ED286